MYISSGIYELEFVPVGLGQVNYDTNGPATWLAGARPVIAMPITQTKNGTRIVGQTDPFYSIFVERPFVKFQTRTFFFNFKLFLAYYKVFY